MAAENPLAHGFANKYGVAFESFDYIVHRKLKPGTEYITRAAPWLGGNVGGGIEMVTPPNSVSLDVFFMIGE